MRLFVSALEYSANIHLKYLLREMIKSENIELCGIFDESIVSNLSLELHSARLRANFGHSQTISLVSRPKFAENYESQTENPSVVDSLHESNKNQSARSANPRKSFCYFLLSQKVESPLPINPNSISGKSLCDIDSVAVMGFIDVIKRAQFFLELRKKCLNLALSADKILLMDSSSFNIPLAKRVKKRDSSKEIMYYILPQVWAWKPWRAKVIEANCDKLAAILPFEVECYEKKVKFVGHPLLDEIQQFRGGNLFWGMQFAPFSHKTALDERSSSISLVSRKNGAKPHRHYFDCDSLHESTTNQAQNCNNSSLRENERSEFSWQSKQKNSASAHQISPDSWCKKSESKGAVVPPADFLLESEKRGSPPKSEKRQLLGTQFKYLGGAGRGVQPFLRKEKGDNDLINSKADLSAESHKKIDSNLLVDSRDLDSSLRATRYAQNDESMDCFGDESPRIDESFVDCHDLPKANLAMTSNSDIFTFMPGSRLSEINRIFPIFFQVKDALKKRDSKAKFHLVVPKKFSTKNLSEIYGDLNDFHITFDAHTSLLQSTFAFICSGTATLECALIGTPFVLGYQGRWIEAFIVKQFLNIRFVGLANLLYSHIAPDSQFHIELLQENLTAQNLLDSYHNANPNDFLEKSLALRAYLKSGSARAVAQWLLEK